MLHRLSCLRKANLNPVVITPNCRFSLNNAFTLCKKDNEQVNSKYNTNIYDYDYVYNYFDGSIKRKAIPKKIKKNNDDLPFYCNYNSRLDDM